MLGFSTLELPASGGQGGQVSAGGMLGKNQDFLVIKITTNENKITLSLFCFLLCKHQCLVTGRLPGWLVLALHHYSIRYSHGFTDELLMPDPDSLYPEVLFSPTAT